MSFPGGLWLPFGGLVTMQLSLILAVLAALVISDGGPNQPVAGAGYRLLTATAGVGLVAVFAAISSGLIASRLRSDFGRQQVLLRRFKQLRRVHVVLWLGVTGMILCWLDWGQLVRFNWHLDRAFLLDDLLILTPVLLPMVLSWAAFYEVDHAVRLGQSGDGTIQTDRSGRRRYLAVHLRHHLGILLLPVLGILAVQDAADLLAPGLLEGDYAAAVYLPAFGLLFLFFPTALRYVWQTRPLEAGPLRERLDDASRRYGLRVREILVWETGSMVVNAAVAGFVRPTRYVFLTDGLLEKLRHEEIEAVFGHEAGHVRHHHLLLRILAMTAPLGLWLAIGQLMPAAGGRLQAIVLQFGLGSQVPLGLVMLAAMTCYVLVVFGAYSRLLECQADLFACRMMGSRETSRPVDVFISALEKLAAAGGADRNARSWQHASITRRVEFLNRVTTEPGAERRFGLLVRLTSLLFVSAVLSPVICRLLLG